MRYIINSDPRLGIEEPWNLTCTPEIIYFRGEINEETASNFRRDLEVAEGNALNAGQKILPICIDSFGGDIYSLLSMIDAVDAIDPNITIATVIEGKAMSAAAAFATCGHAGHRYMGPLATMMIHSASGGSEGTVEAVVNDTRELKRLYDMALDRMARNCNLKKDFFLKKIKENGPEWYIKAKEAKKVGLISHIGIPVMRVKITATHEFGLR